MLKLSQVFVLLLSFFFWLCSVACQILVPWRGIEPVRPAVEAWSPNCWAGRELPVPVLTSESLFKLSSVSFWYDLSFLRGRQESDTAEQLTDKTHGMVFSNLILSQLQLQNHSNRNQDLGTRCSYCYWGVISFKASQVDIAGNICVNVYMYVHISIFSVHICATVSDWETWLSSTIYLHICSILEYTLSNLTISNSYSWWNIYLLIRAGFGKLWLGWMPATADNFIDISMFVYSICQFVYVLPLAVFGCFCTAKSISKTTCKPKIFAIWILKKKFADSCISV